ncbi:hypothetical protein PBV87_12840 [Niameybacter massiliensis]|uniref:Terminase small subunit n=1 Tax=Holtiella tumoricola TaxID=3018743 RepID=A0AA42DNY2_9FIRM|nr:hypothetical protein [Holtiella tumoricola]MDA3732375.1 hypothetical protein [Holtiella tumoricola]
MAEPKQKKTEINSDTIVGTQVLAEIFRVDPRRIRQMVQEGKIPRYKNGSYKLIETLQKYHEYIEGINEDKNVNLVKKESENEKLKLEKIKRKKAELELMQLTGDLVNVEEFKQLYAGLIINFRSKMLALPNKVSPSIVGIDNLITVQDILTKEIYAALEELSKTDINEIEPKVDSDE